MFFAKFGQNLWNAFFDRGIANIYMNKYVILIVFLKVIMKIDHISFMTTFANILPQMFEQISFSR